MFVKDLRALLDELPDGMEIIFENRFIGEYEEDDETDTFNIDAIEVEESLLVLISTEEYI